MTTPDLLRRYHEALSGAKTSDDLLQVVVRFWNDNTFPEWTDNRARSDEAVIYFRHLLRTQGRSCPAACDEAVRRIIEESSNARD